MCREKQNTVELPWTVKNGMKTLINLLIIFLILFFLGLVSVAATHNHFDNDDVIGEKCAICQILSGFSCFNVSSFVMVILLLSLLLPGPVSISSYEFYSSITSNPRAPPTEPFFSIQFMSALITQA